MLELEKIKDFIRAMVRPLVTLSGWGTVLSMTWLGKPIPDFLLAFVTALTAWIFAERAMRHTTENGRPPGP